MKISCPNCRAAFALDDKRVPPAGLSIKCPKCKSPFTVHKPKPGEEGKTVEGRPAAVPLPAARKPASAEAGGTMVDARPVAGPAGTMVDARPPSGPAGTMIDARPVPLPGSAPPASTVIDYRPPPPMATPPVAPPPQDEQGDFAVDTGQDSSAVPLPDSGRAALAPPPPEGDAFGFDAPPPPPAAEGGFAIDDAFALAGDQLSAQQPAAEQGQAEAQQASGDLGFDGAVPLPGGHQDQREPEPAQEPPPSGPSGGDFGFDDAVPLPGGQQDAQAAAAPPAPREGDDAVPLPGGEDAVVAAKQDEHDPFAGIDLGSDTVQDQTPLVMPPEPSHEVHDDFAMPDIAPPPQQRASAPPPSSDDPFSLDLPPAPPPPARPAARAPAASNDDGGINFDFIDEEQSVIPKELSSSPSAPPAPKAASELLDFVDEPQAPKPSSVRAKAPPVMGGAQKAASFDDLADLGGPGLGDLPAADEAGPGEKPKKEKGPGVPLGERLRGLTSGASEGLSSLRQKPRVIGGVVAGVLVLAFVAAGLRAGRTSSGYFWKNKLTSSGKASTVAATAALQKGRDKLAEGTFAASREAQGMAAQTLQVLPDDDDARAFFVLCASELKMGWGQSGADWDQAKGVVEKIKLNGPAQMRARGAYALASGDLAKARTTLASLGDSPAADIESVFLFAQVLVKSNEAAHAAQVLDNGIKGSGSPKLMLLRGVVARARGQVPEAGQWFEKALEKNPKLGRALVELADVQLRKGDLTAAQAVLERAHDPEVRKQLDATEEARASMLRGKLLSAQHQGKEAEAQFERATTLDPKSAEIAGAFGAFRLQRRQYDKAVGRLEAALLVEQTPELLGNLARAYLGVGKYYDADKKVKEALQKDSGNARLVFLQGRITEAIGKPEDAAKEYERALTKKPDLAEALIAQGLYAFKAGDKDKTAAKLDLAVKAPVAERTAPDEEGIGELYLLLGDAAKAKEAFAAAIALDPEDPYSHSGMGRALQALGQLKEAQVELQTALASTDTDPFLHYSYGSLLRQMGDSDGAKASLTKATQLESKDSRFLARLGAVLVERGEFEAAVPVLRSAVLQDDKMPEGLFFLGRALGGTKKLVEAVEVLKKAVEVAPGSAEVLYHLGLVYETGAQVADAIDAFTKSAEKDPKSADAWEHLGANLIVQNRFPEAIDAFKKALAAAPERARLFASMGEAMEQAGDLDGAISQYQKSVKQEPAQSGVWTRLGVAYKEKACDSCKGKAVDALQRAVKIDAKNADAWYQLGYIFKDDRKRNEAIAAFKKFLELRPGSPDASTVKDDVFYLQEEETRAP
jgi:predicted Zn finger-like uncharacterized protein